MVVVVSVPPGMVESEGSSSEPHAARVNVRASPRIAATTRFFGSDILRDLTAFRCRVGATVWCG